MPYGLNFQALVDKTCYGKLLASLYEMAMLKELKLIDRHQLVTWAHYMDVMAQLRQRFSEPDRSQSIFLNHVKDLAIANQKVSSLSSQRSSLLLTRTK